MSFLSFYLINLVLCFGLTIPAWGLLAGHFLLEWPLLWFWLALLLWLLFVLVCTLILRFLRGANIPQSPRENKNPYSAGRKTTEEYRDFKNRRQNQP